MRYAILLAMLLLCLPVRGEAWQVVGGGGEPTLILDDTLYAASTTTIETYTTTPGPGGAWTLATAQPINVSVSGAYIAAGSAFGCAINSISDFADGEVIVKGTTGTTSTSRNFGAGIRFTGGSGYAARLAGGGLFTLDKVTNGSLALLGSTSSCGYIATTTTYTIKVIAVSDALTAKLYDGDAELCSVGPIQDSSYSAGGPALLLTNISSIVAEIKAYAY